MIISRQLSTPIGPMMLFATEIGVLKFAFASEDFDQVSESLAKKFHTAISPDSGMLDDVVKSVDAFFTKKAKSVYCRADLSLSSGFRRLVLENLNYISYGKVMSYSAMARLIGVPRAQRAVGSACATNPVPVILPCHRVIKADGTNGRFAGGDMAKKFLLDLESSV